MKKCSTVTFFTEPETTQKKKRISFDLLFFSLKGVHFPFCLTLYFLTSIFTFSLLFSIHFRWYKSGEFV